VDYSEDMGGDPNIKEIDQNRYDFTGDPEMKQNLKLNLEQIEAQKKDANNDGNGPVGFHEEFMSN